MPTFKAVNNDLGTTLWCGPAALSATTGEPVSKIVEIAKRISGKRQISGMTNHLTQQVASALGYDMVNVGHFSRKLVKNYGSQNVCGRTVYWDPTSRPTLAAWLRQNRKALAEDAYIINVTGHYVAVHGRKFVDNHTCVPVFLSKAPFRRARVVNVFRMRPKSAGQPVVALPIRSVAPPAPAPTPANPKVLSRLSKGLNLWKIAGCPSKNDFIAVYGPEGPKMTWVQRAASGVPAEKFHAALIRATLPKNRVAAALRSQQALEVAGL